MPAISLIPNVYQRLKEIISMRLPRRGEKLDEIFQFIQKRFAHGEKVNIVFVCTHNSRRSVLAEVWCNAIAAYMGLPIRAWSAGTEATAVNPAVVRTLIEEGFRVISPDDVSSPIYKIIFGENGEQIQTWSKTLEDKVLPDADFLAVMVCSDADEACPFVPGADHRIALTYTDPRHSDGTEAEQKAYADCSAQIATELWHLLAMLRKENEGRFRDRRAAKPSTTRSSKKKGNILNWVAKRLKRPASKSYSPPPSPRRSIPNMEPRKMDRMPDEVFPDMIEEEMAMAEPPEQVEFDSMPAEAAPPAAPDPPRKTRSVPEREQQQQQQQQQSTPPPQAFNPFKKGNILYAVPDTMKLNEAARCRVRIAFEELGKAALKEGLSEKEASEAKSEAVRITQVMKVELEEAKTEGNFDIDPRNDLEQPIFPFTFTEWEFDVTPKRPGHYALLLRVTAKVVMEGFGERGMNVAVLDRAIVVTTGGEVLEAQFAEQPIPDPSWDPEDSAAVRNFIAHGNTNKAIERMCNYVFDKDEDLHEALLILQGRWNETSNKLEAGSVRFDDWDLMNNQVRESVLGFLEDLEEL